MIFVRITVSHTRGEVVATHAQDTPYERGGEALVPGEECETIDLGAIEDHDWTDLSGNPCIVTQHIHERLRAAKLTPRDLLEKRTSPALHVEGLHGLAAVIAVRTIHDAPCTMDSLRAHLRQHGRRRLPVKIQAWLANVLPDHHVKAMGLARGLPISAMKAAERLRNIRDPRGGSRLPRLERIAQKLSDLHSRRHLDRARKAGKGKP